MFTRKYFDGSDGREVGLKRQRILDSSSPFFGGLGSPSSSVTYNSSHGFAGQPPPFPVVRLRGLPFDCKEIDIIEFFHGLDIVDILFVHKNGKLNGDAFCVFAFPLQVDFALHKNRQNMGRRYIEVFRSTRQEYYSAVAEGVSAMKPSAPQPRPTLKARSMDDGKEKDSVDHTRVLRMRGLPYSAGKEDVLEFFQEYNLLEDSVHIVLNSEGRSSGEAFVEFGNSEDSRSAMAKDRMTLGSRYIELFPSTPKELEDAIPRTR